MDLVNLFPSFNYCNGLQFSCSKTQQGWWKQVRSGQDMWEEPGAQSTGREDKFTSLIIHEGWSINIYS